MDKTDHDNLPQAAVDYIDSVIKAMKYRRKVRAEVRDELTAHFADALATCADEPDKLRRAEELIGQFGDAKLLAVLIRRGKKRCRPLWRTMLVRMFQAAGILFLLLAIYVGWFFSGKPVIATNYLEVMNQTVRPTADDSQNAWPLYQQAAEKYVGCGDNKIDKNPRSLSILTDKERTVLLKWIADNENSLALVRQGNQKPYYWPIYDTGESKNNDLLAMVIPNLSEYLNIARLLCWQALLCAERGDIQNAFDKTLEVYSFGQHLRGQNTTLIEQLVAIAIESNSMETMRTLLDENIQSIDAPLLDSVQKRFDGMVSKENFIVSFKAENLCIFDITQRYFTQPYVGKSHLYFQNSHQSIIFAEMSNYMGYKISGKEYFHILFTHPDRKQTRQTGEHFYAEMTRLAPMTPASLRKQGVDIDKRGEELTRNNLLLKILTPAIGKIVLKSWRIPADTAATVTIFSILQYHKSHNAYPDSLEALVQAGLLREVPMDPFSDKPLVYRKTDDGFKLYSVGSNFIDDGGVPGTDKDGKPRQWGDNGDEIFWPVSKE